MDQAVVEVLSKAGITLTPRPPDVRDGPAIAIMTLDDCVLPMGDTIPVIVSDDAVVEVTPKKLTELFTGTKVGFTSPRPPNEYAHFIFMMMWTCLAYCESAGKAVRDVELVEIYNHLRRRPDGSHANPLYSYLRATARVYLSLVDVSRDEYESLMEHLRVTAKRHVMGPTSAGYLATMKAVSEP